ncbi:Junctional adhesion molecule-like [Labeo rohita]|uniref:Junctional adhesion molecule-like n=1 Tax=Labeo rohita TaxID=84645 RepID=A0ABQ8L3J5_LABRO|nr:Junctional adhesion molecule-like [Labeo rohita]
MGESISLNCSMTNRYEIAWYQLRSEHLDLLIAAEKDETGRKLLINYNPNSNRLKITADTWVTRATLVIFGVTESDSGLYFCGTKSDAPEMFFDKPIRLEIEDEVTTKETALMFGGVGLAVLVFFVATAIAGGIIHYRGWQKGWAAAKRSSLIQHRSPKVT